MRTNGASSVLVTDPEGHLLGVYERHDDQRAEGG